MSAEEEAIEKARMAAHHVNQLSRKASVSSTFSTSTFHAQTSSVPYLGGDAESMTDVGLELRRPQDPRPISNTNNSINTRKLYPETKSILKPDRSTMLAQAVPGRPGRLDLNHPQSTLSTSASLPAMTQSPSQQQIHQLQQIQQANRTKSTSSTVSSSGVSVSSLFSVSNFEPKRSMSMQSNESGSSSVSEIQTPTTMNNGISLLNNVSKIESLEAASRDTPEFQSGVAQFEEELDSLSVWIADAGRAIEAYSEAQNSELLSSHYSIQTPFTLKPSKGIYLCLLIYRFKQS
jgi:hypothetical protein